MTTARRRGQPGSRTAVTTASDPVLAPRSIALIGASERTYFARNIFRNLWEHRYRGTIHLVNARRSIVFGEPAVPTLKHIGGVVDQAVVMASQEHLPTILDDCVATGVRSVVILTSVDPADLASGTLRSEVARLRATHGLRALGPSSLGYINVRDRVPATVTHLRRLPPPGPIAVLSQSGAFMITALRLLEERAAGASFLVSLGNEIDLDLEYYLERAIDDPDTQVICLVVEGVRRPAEFVALAGRALAAGKPIVALKLGRSDQGKQLALSHTGALAGSHEAFEAICRRFGIVLAGDFDELIDLAVLLSQLPPSRGETPRVGVVVASGGAGLMAADAAAVAGVPLPALTPETRTELQQILPPYASIANPLDTTAQVRTEADLFDRATACFAADPNLDVALFVFALGLPDATSPSHQASFEQVARLRGQTDKPLLAAAASSQAIPTWGKRFLRRSGVPYLRTVGRAFWGLQAWADHGRARAEHATTVHPDNGNAARGRAFERPDGGAATLDEWTSKQRLAEYGLRGPHEAIAGSLDQARKIARGIGYPVALKAVSAALPHKAAVGGVALNIRDDDDDLTTRWQAMEQAIRPLLPDDEPFQALISEMVPGGLEILLGIHTDPQFGPLVACGPGGAYAEAIGRVALAMPPLTEAHARDLLDRSGLGRVLRSEGRGQPLDVEATIRAIQAVGSFAVDHRGIVESLDINPLAVLRRGQGVRVLDALIVLPEPSTRPERRASNGTAHHRERKRIAATPGGGSDE